MSNKKVIHTADGFPVKVGMEAYCVVPYGVHIKKCNISKKQSNKGPNGLFIESSYFLTFDGKMVREPSLRIWIPASCIFVSKLEAAKSALSNLKRNRPSNKREIQEFETSIENGNFND